MSEDFDNPDDRAMFERDLAVRQLRTTEATLKVIQMALNENRPLRALDAANGALDELDESLDVFDDSPFSEGSMLDGRDGGGGALTDIGGVTERIADELRKEGYINISALRGADQNALEDVPGISKALAARIKADVAKEGDA